MIQKTQGSSPGEHLERRFVLRPTWRPDGQPLRTPTQTVIWYFQISMVKRSGRFIQDPHQNPVVSQTHSGDPLDPSGKRLRS